MKEFYISKVVKAESIQEAIKKEKEVEVGNIELLEDTEENNKIGFRGYERD